MSDKVTKLDQRASDLFDRFAAQGPFHRGLIGSISAMAIITGLTNPIIGVPLFSLIAWRIAHQARQKKPK